MSCKQVDWLIENDKAPEWSFTIGGNGVATPGPNVHPRLRTDGSYGRLNALLQRRVDAFVESRLKCSQRTAL